MCGRFTRRATRRHVADHFGIDVEDVPEFVESWNIAPNSFQPVIRLDREGLREVALMRWGLVPFWAANDKSGFSTINAKAEEVATKPMWREAFRRRRCLVPADAFYEWQKLDAKNKQPWAIALKDDGLYSFAGLWERWTPRGGLPLETFAIITTDPNEVVEPLHNRMPVILEPKDYSRWLDTSDADQLPLDLLRPFPAEKMQAWAVNRAVGNTRNDRPDLMDPMSEV